MSYFFKFVLVFGLLESLSLWAEPSVTVRQFLHDETKDVKELAWLDGSRIGDCLTALSFVDFPKNQRINMSIRRLAAEDPNDFQPQLTFHILPDGRLRLREGVIDRWLLMNSFDFLPGEQCVVKFETPDGSFSHQTSLIPFPLRKYNSNRSIAIEALLCSKEPTIYGIMIRGLSPGETYLYEASSGNERISKNKTYKNKQIILFAPELPDAEGGIGHVRVRTSSGASVELDFPWGNELHSF